MQAKQGEVFDFIAEGQVETDEENDMKSFNDDTIIDKKEGIGKDVKPLFLNQAHATEDVKEVVPIGADFPEAEVPSPTSSLGLISQDSFLDRNMQAKQANVFGSIEGCLETGDENTMKNVIDDGENDSSEEIGRNDTDDAKPEDTDSPGMESLVSDDEDQGLGKKSCYSKGKNLVEKVHDIAMKWSTVLPKYPINTSWPVVAH